MTPMLMFYLSSAIVAAIGLAGIEAWEYRNDPAYTPMTLAHLFQGAFISLCPFVNSFACIGITVYFLTSIAPRIVLFGKKKQ